MRRGSVGGEGGSEGPRWVTVEQEALTRRVLAAAIAVHRHLGPGFLESVYQGALECEFRQRAIAYEREREVEVVYRGVVVGRHRLDLVASGEVIVELKAIRSLEPVHFAQLRSYLKATQFPIGLLLNFGESRLGIRRVIVKRPFSSSPSDPPSPPTLPRPLF